MFNAFRRRATDRDANPHLDGPGPQGATPAAPGASEPAAAGGRIDTDMVDTLEADVLKAIAAFSGAIEVASGDVAAARGDLERIEHHMGDLAAAGRGAAAQTLALAASTEELAATSGEINGAMNQATSSVGEAVSCARDANGLIAELARATEEIVGIVDTIASVARQTNLLALNATIEAARAGVAGRGFAVVASEVKSLSVETGTAANDIRERISKLRDSAGSSIAAVERVVGVIQGVQPVFAAVRNAVDEQNASIGELARRAAEASSYVEQVSARSAEVNAAATQASGRMVQAGEATARADGLAKTLGQRFVAVVRQHELGHRRRADRFPVELDATLTHRGRAVRTRSIDIGEGGMLLAPAAGCDAFAGATVELQVERLGRLHTRVAGVSHMGLHCSFEGLPADDMERVVRFVNEVEEEYRPLITVARDNARRLEEALERLIQEGRLTREDLFDTEYRPVPGTNPAQFETRATAALERVIPEILEPLLVSDNRMVFCIAVDRNGYVPVHNRRCSLPQRPNDPVWNAANCRNKRIFDDRAGIAAARSSRPFLVQAYLRDMGGGQSVMVREIDAPIRIHGRHWGGFRTAYRL